MRFTGGIASVLLDWESGLPAVSGMARIDPKSDVGSVLPRIRGLLPPFFFFCFNLEL